MTEMTLQEVGEPKEEVTATPAAPVQTMHILVCYETESLGKITLPLDRHLQLMYRRLSPQVRRHYFGYQTLKEPKPYTGDSPYLKEQYEKEKESYEKQLKDYNGTRATMIRFLQQEQLLLILYVSNSMMEHLWKDMDQDPELKRLLTNPNHRIAPVLITPTAGMALNCEPLCAFEGTAFETACQHITETIEAVARAYFGETLESPAETPFALLTSPSTVHVSVPSKADRTDQMLAGLQAILEQTHTRVVESQQQALASRSSLQESEDALRREVEGMKQQITTLQTWQNASLAAKLRRLFSH
jgi:hypothetical protein